MEGKEMPIYNIGDERNKEIVFGTGDIKVSSGWDKEDKSIGILILRSQESKPIGTIEEHPDEEVDRGEAPVRMIFHKTESIDVMIERLQKVKEYMTKE
jgi:hypothetical protein